MPKTNKRAEGNCTCALATVALALGLTLLGLIYLCQRASADTRRPVLAWASRVVQDSDQPEWKQRFARKAIAGQCGRIELRTTAYSDRDDIDPGTGGGKWGCTWFDPGHKRLPSLLLQHGYVACDLGYWPTGTVFYAAPPFNRTWIVADCGPGVRGRSRVDVYCPDWETWRHYKQFESNHGTRITVWVLGRITRQQAKG